MANELLRDRAASDASALKCRVAGQAGIVDDGSADDQVLARPLANPPMIAVHAHPEVHSIEVVPCVVTMMPVITS